MNDRNIFWLDPPIKKIEKSKNVKQLILMNVHFLIYPILFRNIIYLAKILRDLLSNKNGIANFWKKSIIQ